jgi:hypothetical protein
MRLYLLQRNTYYNIFAAFVNNRKCDCDEFKCVNWIRKSSLSGSRYCTVSSIWCSCFTDIIVFLIGTDYNPQQSSYYVLNWTFFSHSHVMHMSAWQHHTIVSVGTRHITVSRHITVIVSPPWDRHPILISLWKNKPTIWVRTWISWVQNKIMFGCTLCSICLILWYMSCWNKTW